MSNSNIQREEYDTFITGVSRGHTNALDDVTESETNSCAMSQDNKDECADMCVAKDPVDRGIVLFPNGDSYEGEWKGDKMKGNGTYKFKSGSVYTGDFEKSLRHGLGTMTYSNGDIYSGEWVNDRIAGKGKVTKMRLSSQ